MFPFETNNFHYSLFFIRCFLEIFQCLQINHPPCITHMYYKIKALSASDWLANCIFISRRDLVARRGNILPKAGASHRNIGARGPQAIHAAESRSQITNSGDVVSHRAISISSRDSIARADIALPELNGNRVRSRVCEHHPIWPATSVHLSIKSDHNYTPV